MPRAETNIGHVALTDHRIPRRPDPGKPADPPAAAASRLLVPFGRDALDPADAELTRDWAVVLVARARTQSEAVRTEVSRAARPHLERAARAHPDDLPVRESLGVALAWQRDLQRALAEHDAALAVAPRRELILSDAGVTAARLGLTDRSLDYWRRAAAVNPSSSRYRYEAATQLARRGDAGEAIAGLKAVLARSGGHVGSRVVLMQLYYRNGLKAQARDEWTAILALRPPDEAELRRRFEPLFR
jgi:tetratricopeptide (TPR) repeat protein